MRTSITSTITTTTISTIIITTLLTALLVQSSLSLPISSINGDIATRTTAKATRDHSFLSEHSGMFVAMESNGSISATGELYASNTMWHTTYGTTDEIQFSIYSHSLQISRYLVLAVHQNRTFLLAHDLSKKLTVGDLPALVKEAEVKEEEKEVLESSSGDGAPSLVDLPTAATTANTLEDEDTSLSNNTADGVDNEEEGDAENVLFSVDWVLERHPVHPTEVRFRALFPDSSEHKDCYLAFDHNGLPEANLCQSSAESSRIVFKVSQY